MTFKDVLAQVIAWLQQDGRASYRALTRQFDLNDDYLDPAIHIMMDAVHRFEGTVNQVLGDGIMALFGAPIAHEDHAARACYAALAMQAAEKSFAGGLAFTQSLWCVYLSEAFLLANRLEDARLHAERALSLSMAHHERGEQAYVLHLLGDIARQCDPSNVTQVQTHYQESLALANDLHMRPLQAHCHRSLGILHHHTGQAEQARVELATAIEMYRAMEMTFWLPETEAALTEVEGR